MTRLIKLNIAVVDSEALVILFGSRARGDVRNDSDQDILVLTKYPATWQEEKKFRDQYPVSGLPVASCKLPEAILQHLVTSRVSLPPMA